MARFLNQDDLVAAGLSNAMQISGVAPAPQATADGSADVSQQVAAANTANKGFIRLPAGARYRISSNISIGNIIAEGGVLVIDAGVVVTFGSVIGADNVVVFDGAGIARHRGNKYSLGWYAGASGTAKWNAMRRAFVTSPNKTVIIPRPDSSDPAYAAAEYGSAGWSAPAPWIFDDPENNMTVHQEAPIVGTVYGQPCVVEFSPVNKTEDHRWYGLHIDGGNKARHGILAHGGARQQFYGLARINNCTGRPVEWLNDLWPADQMWFQELYVARYGDGIRLVGTGANGSGINCLNNSSRIDRIVDNGARGLRATVTATAGAITAITVPTQFNGSNQLLTGFEPGQTYYINGDASAGTGGYNATATATVNASTGVIDLSSFTITAGGAGFTTGDTVVITTAQNVIKYQGWHTNPHLAAVYNNVIAPQATCAGPLVLLETSSVAGVQDGIFENIYSELRGRQMFASTAGAGVTTVFHTYTLRNVRSIYAMQNPALSPVEMGWVRDGNYTEMARQTNNSVYINVGNNSTNISFTGIPMERVSGVFGAGFYFDGEPGYFTTARGTDTAGVTSMKPFSGFVSLRRITLISNTPNVWGEFLMVDDNTLITIAKGSLVEPRNNAGLSGTTSTAGNFGVSLSNGVFYHENRTGAAVRYKVVAGR